MRCSNFVEWFINSCHQIMFVLHSRMYLAKVLATGMQSFSNERSNRQPVKLLPCCYCQLPCHKSSPFVSFQNCIVAKTLEQWLYHTYIFFTIALVGIALDVIAMSSLMKKLLNSFSNCFNQAFLPTIGVPHVHLSASRTVIASASSLTARWWWWDPVRVTAWLACYPSCLLILASGIQQKLAVSVSTVRDF